MDRLLILGILISIMYIDMRKMYIPNFLNILLLLMAIYYKGMEYEVIENSILGMGIYILPILLLYGYLSDFLQREVFGFGDIKLLMSLGYILGYSSFYDVYLYYILTFGIGAIIGVVLGILRKNFKGESPFSPFLIIVFIYMWVR